MNRFPLSLLYFLEKVIYEMSIIKSLLLHFMDSVDLISCF